MYKGTAYVIDILSLLILLLTQVFIYLIERHVMAIELKLSQSEQELPKILVCNINFIHTFRHNKYPNLSYNKNKA